MKALWLAVRLHTLRVIVGTVRAKGETQPPWQALKKVQGLGSSKQSLCWSLAVQPWGQSLTALIAGLSVTPHAKATVPGGLVSRTQSPELS